jgi:hypothetical protein
VVFQRPDGLIAYRVPLVRSGGGERSLRTKGDNVLGLDPALTEDGLVGQVLEVRRGGCTLNLDTRPWRGAGG